MRDLMGAEEGKRAGVISRKDLEGIFDKHDVDRNRTLDFEEFCQLFEEPELAGEAE